MGLATLCRMSGVPPGYVLYDGALKKLLKHEEQDTL